MNMVRLPSHPVPFGDAEIETLSRILAQSNAEQRLWLSGFIAGFDAARSRGDSAEPPAPSSAAAGTVLILYATESGNSEGIAFEVKKKAGRLGIPVAVRDVADVDLSTVADADVVLVVASTWGEGDPPARAAGFYRSLMAEDAPALEGVRFSVLALGDSTYANFCETGRRIDARLAELGALRIVERIECDLDFEAPSAAWIDDVLGKIGRTGNALPAMDLQPLSRADSRAHDKKHPYEAEIGDLIDLNGSRSGKSTFHVEVALDGSGLNYEPGDAIGVVAANDPAEVDAVCAAAGIVPDDGLRDALLRRHEITTLAPTVVERYAALAADEELQAIVDAGHAREYAAGRHVVDLLTEFSRSISGDELTGLLRPLTPRLYSVASSRKATPGEAHILVGLVRYESHGRNRKGVASAFIGERRGIGDRIPIYVKPNLHFRLPDDGAAPIVMIGPGTGVAPFRAFMQEREAVGATGRNWLFFGDRNYTQDFLYQLEWQEYLGKGLLTRLDVAFSRDQPEKIYVQDRMWDARSDLFAWLEEGAHLYVCGDASRMAVDVQETLVRVVMDRGALGKEAAQAYVAELEASGRYRRDVY